MPTQSSLQTASLVLIMSSLIQPATAQPGDKPWTADPAIVAKFSKRRGTFNYDEAKVPAFTLPDPLVTDDGEPVTSAEQWKDVRRPELMELFRRDVYGRRPKVDYTVTFAQEGKDVSAFDGAAIGRKVVVKVARGGREFSFPFVVFLPAKLENPAPAVVLINNRHFVPLEKAMGEEDPFWPVKSIVERGYATATFHTSDVDPDRRDGYAEGIRSFLADGKAPADDAWRSLSAWGWAASRVLDYLSTCEQVDTSRAAVVGHSRGGKTALWAAAEDERFAIAYSNESGCGGAALSRRRFGETVGRITSSFPHWFCANFTKYAEREDKLPVDQHELIALIAPRAVYVASADEDLWADPRGEYGSLMAAAPVYRIIGKPSITAPEMPALEKPRHEGATGYHIRRGAHGLKAIDWGFFLDFADGCLRD